MVVLGFLYEGCNPKSGSEGRVQTQSYKGLSNSGKGAPSRAKPWCSGLRLGGGFETVALPRFPLLVVGVRVRWSDIRGSMFLAWV